MTRDEIIEWLRRYAAAIAEHKLLLTDLDAAIGDGDHGINMDRGMSEVAAKLPMLADRDIGAVLNGVGMTMLSKVGGASGPLYGTFFMRFSKESIGKFELTGEEFLAGRCRHPAARQRTAWREDDARCFAARHWRPAPGVGVRR